MEKFKQCKICNEIHNYQSGVFAQHLKERHGISREQYVIVTEYNNQVLKCQCGYCDDNALFISRKNCFHKINPEHRNFEWLKNKFIENNGEPKCKTCGDKVRFYRGRPNVYCSPICQPSNWNQDTIKKTVMEKYGVDNVMKLKSVKKKVAQISKKFWKNNKEEGVKKLKATKKLRYGDENYTNVEKMRETNIKKYGADSYSKTDKFRKKASDTAIKTNGENSILIKQYKNTDLYYQGTYEYKFLEHCENIEVFEFVKRAKSFNYLKEDQDIGHRHLPDFMFKSEYIIEIKSTYILNKQGGSKVIEAKKRSVENSGYEYILVLDNNFDIFTKIINHGTL